MIQLPATLRTEEYANERAAENERAIIASRRSHSRHDFPDDVACYVVQPEISTGVAVG